MRDLTRLYHDPDMEMPELELSFHSGQPRSIATTDCDQASLSLLP